MSCFLSRCSFCGGEARNCRCCLAVEEARPKRNGALAAPHGCSRCLFGNRNNENRCFFATPSFDILVSSED
ncbi:hypothetical protein DXT94_29210 [Rhizobium sp. ICMP 5592]|nr:hypothetical protein [Rhizobium sp. ICMP 5592]